MNKRLATDPLHIHGVVMTPELDPRGVGLSDEPADPGTLRVDRLVSEAARMGYFGSVELDPVAITAVLRTLAVPVLLYAGDMDPLVTPSMARKAAPLFGSASVVVQPGAGHYPWIDDPAAFTAAVSPFLN